MKVEQQLERLLVAGYDDAIMDVLTQYYMKIIANGEYYEIKKCYSIFDRLSNNKSVKDVPTPAIMVNDEIQLKGETAEEYAERMRIIDRYGTPTGLLTLAQRMKCNTNGNISPVKYLQTHWDSLIKEINSSLDELIERSERGEQDCEGVSESVIDRDNRMGYYICGYFYDRNMLVHTFPIYRCLAIFQIELDRIIDRIRTRELSVVEIHSKLKVWDSSSGWGDRLYAAILWWNHLANLLTASGYSAEEVEQFRGLRCYEGFDVNREMEPVYASIVRIATRNTGLPESCAIVHMFSSISNNARAIWASPSTQGFLLTSSPTPQESYSNCSGDSMRNSPYNNEIGGQTWLHGFLFTLHRMTTYRLRIYDFIDNFTVAYKDDKGNYKKRTVEVSDALQKFLSEILGKRVTPMRIGYANSAPEHMRGCAECKKGNDCDKCNNTYILRTIVMADFN